MHYSSLTSSNQSLNRPRAKSVSNTSLSKTLVKPKQNASSNKSLVSTGSNPSLPRIKKTQSGQSLTQKSKSSKTSKKSNSNLYESLDYSIEKLNGPPQISNKSPKEATKRVFAFTTMWKNQKFLYFNIQEALFVLNLLSTLTILGLSIWINIDARFVFVSGMSNRLIYSSFNRLIGILPFVCLLISCVAMFVDACNFVLHIFIKSFLNNHDDRKIRRILVNQKTLAKMVEANVTSKLACLKLRNKIVYRMRNTLRSIRSLTYMNTFIYVFVLLGAMYFLGIYLHFLSDVIINYQLSQTLMKLIKEYEAQQITILNQMTLQTRTRNVATGSVEEQLVNQLNVVFACCHYQNPFQYGELAPANCDFSRGCLRPLQEFMWDYLYFSVIIVLFVASFKFCIQFVWMFNFRVVLVNRLFRKLYEVDVRKYHAIYEELSFPDEENPLGDTNDDDDDEDDEILTKEKYAKLQEIREKKFEQLQKEEEEEQMRKEKEEEELSKFLENDKRQEAYELMLLKQNRIDEYRYEQAQRKMQLQHYLDRKENNFRFWVF